MRRYLLVFAVLFLFLLMGCSELSISTIEDLTGAVIIEQVDNLNYEKPIEKPKTVTDSGQINAYFCPEYNCSDIIVQKINDAQKTVYCAFYELELANVIHALQQSNADIRLITDNQHPTDFPFAKTDNRTGLMHNKFCVIDGKTVISGSYNPTYSGLDNENNLVIIESEKLAQNYDDEFQEMWYNYFGKGNLVENPVVEINGTKIENYFCPEDWCTDKVLKTLNLANKSINFMIFSFTDDSIGELLIKKHDSGINVSGLLDNFQNKGSQYSEYKKLLNASINVSLWGDSKAFLHNKVFIVDDKIVITGSYNPSNNGDRVNDENILIIYDEEIAKKYVEKLDELRK